MPREEPILFFDVDYKVAPEYPYPCALEEGEDVVTYLLAHMADYDGDRNRTALMGETPEETLPSEFP